MKKFLALIVACVTVAGSNAATVFDSDDFIEAAPVLMKGTLKAETWMLDEEACVLDKGKVSYPVYLAFCQPCIRCIECEDEVELAYATMYIVDKDKADKIVYITEVDISGVLAEVTTGKAGEDAKKGDVVLPLSGLGPQDNFGEISDTVLFGNWNQKTWFSGNDEASNGVKVKATMGIIQKLAGNISSTVEDLFWACGTLALRRDDSFTKKLMMAMTEDTKGSVSNPFLNCGDDEINLDDCEDVMTVEGSEDGNTMVENYVLKKSVPKSYSYSVSGGSEE